MTDQFSQKSDDPACLTDLDQHSTDESTLVNNDSQPVINEPKQYHFVKDEMLIVAMQAGGINEVCISKLKNEDFYIVSVLYKQTCERHYLTTRRVPGKPRKFRHIDIAIATVKRLIGVTKFVVDLDPDEQP